MVVRPPAQVVRWFGWASPVAGSICLCTGLLVLIGWSVGLEALTNPSPASPPMRPSTAVGCTLIGLALVVDHRSVVRDSGVPVGGKDGSRVPLLVGVATLDSPQCIAFIVDLSQRRRAESARAHADDALRRSEEQLRHAQKMEAVGRLAGGVAHDFNNILSVIMSYSAMIGDELRAGDPLRADIEEIGKAASRAEALTRQLLTFSRQDVVVPRTLRVDEVIAAMERMMRRVLGEDIDLELIFQSDLGAVRADPSHIEQIVMNLAVNARDAMPTGGKLTIETKNTVLDEAYGRSHLGVTPGSYVELAVTDNGCGMDRATQSRIFEPFFTTKEKGKGTGLGLSTVFGIVQQCGGSIWVYSEPGHGTTFRIYLPAAAATAEDAVPAPSPVALRGNETILLVEDEDRLRVLARGILQRNGYRVLDARNAGEALLHRESYKGQIDLLLTDVVMPQMSGPALAQRLRSLRPSVKVLCMSGYSDDALVRHGALEAGVAYLQKPITPERLSTKVRAVLDARA